MIYESQEKKISFPYNCIPDPDDKSCLMPSDLLKCLLKGLQTLSIINISNITSASMMFFLEKLFEKGRLEAWEIITQSHQREKVFINILIYFYVDFYRLRKANVGA